MADASTEYHSVERINCGCLPADVILCVPPEIIADKLCPEFNPDTPVEQTQTFEYDFIEAEMVSEEEVSSGCRKYWKYVFTYDDTQLVDGAILTGANILGVVCKNCFTDWVENIAGDEVHLLENEDGSISLVSQHGCVYGIPNQSLLGVTDTPSVDLTITGAVPQNLSADVNISADVGNVLTVEPDGLFVPAAGFSVDDTNSINLTDTATVITADAIISTGIENVLRTEAAGMYSPMSWRPAGETWTYLSASSVTVPTNATLKYQKGDKVRISHGGAYLYFYIINVTATVLTFYTFDYVVSNAAITANDFSRDQSPFGFPAGFNTPASYGTQAGSITFTLPEWANFQLDGAYSTFFTACVLQIDTSSSEYITQVLPVPFVIAGASYSSVYVAEQPTGVTLSSGEALIENGVATIRWYLDLTRGVNPWLTNIPLRIQGILRYRWAL